jgi:Skp family chaperone for outer membrane proteins
MIRWTLATILILAIFRFFGYQLTAKYVGPVDLDKYYMTHDVKQAIKDTQKSADPNMTAEEFKKNISEDPAKNGAEVDDTGDVRK